MRAPSISAGTAVAASADAPPRRPSSSSSSYSSPRRPLSLALVAAMCFASVFVDGRWKVQLPPQGQAVQTSGADAVGRQGASSGERQMAQADEFADNIDTTTEEWGGAVNGSGLVLNDGDPGSSPPPRRRMPLEALYEDTSNGTNLQGWAKAQVMEVYASFPDVRSVRVGTPSIAHDSRTNRTVVGFRVNTYSGQMVHSDFQYLMLCERVAAEVKDESEMTGTERPGMSGQTSIEQRWKCQDSGMENAYVPPECDRKHWKAPARVAAPWMGGWTTIGPEDSRLYLDVNGNLGATMVMRGCHPDTSFGNSTPLYSVYGMQWQHTHGQWRVDGNPKLLTLRQPDMSSLGDSYPEATKSWISIPGPKGYPSLRSWDSLLYSVGWTRNMSSHVVYRVANATSTLFMMVPESKTDYSSLDLDHYRISTNVVRFHGALLAMGHRKVDSVYYHYWYAFCPNAPHVAVAMSDLLHLPDEPGLRVSFALGLAHEGDYLYLSWSQRDSEPQLSRYEHRDVLQAFRNSTFAAAAAAAEGGNTWPDDDENSFARFALDACAGGSARQPEA